MVRSKQCYIISEIIPEHGGKIEVPFKDIRGVDQAVRVSYHSATEYNYL